ncbi:MAG: diaminopimelate epimerase [Oscillospiraceae bacterium]|nr:diaminopimelate epimerase [Oscillospiraceae bacterium]
MKFFKYHACGNDYVYIDCFENFIEDPGNLSKKISKRRFGIGSDGLIMICPSDVADAKMRIFNSDGGEAKMCGNGIRCTAKYLYDEMNIKKENIKIETLSGIKNARILKTNKNFSVVSVDMGKPEFIPYKIPADFNSENIINVPFNILKEKYNITCISMGNPHCVIFADNADNLEKLDIKKIGTAFQNCKKFPEGMNVEFVKIERKNVLSMRVWERGSGETSACGTGACAAAIASVLNNLSQKEDQIKVILKGGEILVDYKNDNVIMTGEAVKVFEGEF